MWVELGIEYLHVMALTYYRLIHTACRSPSVPSSKRLLKATACHVSINNTACPASVSSGYCAELHEGCFHSAYQLQTELRLSSRKRDPDRH